MEQTAPLKWMWATAATTMRQEHYKWTPWITKRERGQTNEMVR